MLYKELDVVKMADTSGNIAKGTRGTIVHIYEKHPDWMEVEFRIDGTTIVRQLSQFQVEPVYDFRLWDWILPILIAIGFVLGVLFLAR